MPGKTCSAMQRRYFAIFCNSWHFLSGGPQPYTFAEDSKLGSYTAFLRVASRVGYEHLPACVESTAMQCKTQAMLWILPFRDARIGSQLSESDPWASDFVDISWHFLTLHVSVLSVLGQYWVSAIRFVVRLVVTRGDSGVAVVR